MGGAGAAPSGQAVGGSQVQFLRGAQNLDPGARTGRHLGRVLRHDPCPRCRRLLVAAIGVSVRRQHGRHPARSQGRKALPAGATTGRRTSAVCPRQRTGTGGPRPGRMRAGRRLGERASRQRIPYRLLSAGGTLASYRVAPTSAVGLGLPTAGQAGPPVLALSLRHAGTAARGRLNASGTREGLARRQIRGAMC